MQGVFFMGAGAEIAAGIIGGLFDGAKSIYDIWNNERNFDYQKALQQEMFWREDTAVQRRMLDLKAAGINPNLAAGSAAGAGAVVGRSNTPSLSGNPIGTALDMSMAVQQLRAQREQNEILKNQRIKSEEDAAVARNERVLNDANLYQMLGIPMNLDYVNRKFSVSPKIEFYVRPDGRMNWDIVTFLGKDGGGGYRQEFQDSPLQKLFKWQVQNNRNSADLLQRDVDFYTADKIMDYFGAGVSAFSGIGSGVRAFRGRR